MTWTSASRSRPTAGRHSPRLPRSRRAATSSTRGTRTHSPSAPIRPRPRTTASTSPGTTSSPTRTSTSSPGCRWRVRPTAATRWHVTYADKIPGDLSGCSFAQYIGATPSVAANGTLYVAAEKIAVSDPDCTGVTPTFSEWIFKSTNGGQSFNAGHQLATVTETGDLILGRGMVMRNLEFPSMAIGPDRHGLCRLERRIWRRQRHPSRDIDQRRRETGPCPGELNWRQRPGAARHQRRQPGPTPHLLHTELEQHAGCGGLQLPERQAARFSPKRVTSQSLRRAYSPIPQFDPIIAFGYMGDYIANVCDGATTTTTPGATIVTR